MSRSPSPPRDVTLDQLKRQAKRLLKSYQDGSADARQQFSHHPKPIPSQDAQLTDAQLVLARTFGFDSWPRLRRSILGRDLRQSIWDRDVDAVRRTVDEEADILGDVGPHPRWGGQPTALQVAAERGQVDIVRLLLEHGADPEERGEYGWKPVHLAAHWGHDDVVHLLLEKGARLDIFTACLRGDIEAMGRLLAADPSLATTPGLGNAPPLHCATALPVARLLIEHHARLDTVDSMGNTPLESALNRSARDVAVYLLEQGADATPCDLAALGLTERLLQRIEIDAATSSFVGNIGINAVRGTPLHAAVAGGAEDTARALLGRGADPNARADMGQSPLHMAESAAIARLLVEAGADPKAVDDEHGTPPLNWARVGIEIRGDSPERQELVRYLEGVTAD
jgi:ankyrin repeat protein